MDYEPKELRMKIYKDPFQDGKILIGYKGGSFADTGYIYSPYVPLQKTAVQNVEVPAGMASKYCPKLIDEAMSYYGKETINKRAKKHRSIMDEWEVSRLD